MVKEVDTNGFWRIRDNPLSKEGVFPYLGKQIDKSLIPDKIYWVYRPMSEISAPETVESFNAAPLIDEHEMIGEGWTPYDDRPAGGVVYNTHAKDGKLYGDIRIYSEKLKDEIESGKKELSMGYECNYEPEKGVFEGKQYDFVQRNLRGNHIALVNRGRMGSDVRVYDHFTFDTLEGIGEVEQIAQDENDDIQWITVNGNHIPIKNGQSKEDAITDFFNSKQENQEKTVKYNISDVSGMFKSGTIKEHIDIDLPEIYEKKLPAYISEAIWWHEHNKHFDEDIEIPEKFKNTDQIVNFIEKLDFNADKKKDYIDSIKRLDGIIETYGKIKEHFENPPKGENIDSFGDKIKNPEKFKEWFGKSKALDKNGNPIVLFHGSKEQDLEKGQFDFKHKGDSQNKQKAIFMNTREDVAKGYTEQVNGDGEKGKLHKVYVKMERPLVVDFEGSSFSNGGHKEFEVHPYGEEPSYSNTTTIKRRSAYADSSEAPVISKIVNYAKKNGYDGVIAKNIVDVQKYDAKYDYGDYSDDYIVFDPKTQIKSVDNNGEWEGKTIYDEEIPSQDGSPKESGVDSSFNIKGEDTLEKVDKRKGISEVEAMLYEAKKDPAKLTDELIKTILQKMENNSYEASEKTKADDEDVKESEDEAKSCKDGCKTEDGCKAKDEDDKKDDVKDESGVAKEENKEEAPTEEKKEEGKKEDKKAEDAMIAVADALPEILQSLNEIKASLAQKQSATDSAPITYGLDEETPAYSKNEDKVLKKYLGEI